MRRLLNRWKVAFKRPANPTWRPPGPDDLLQRLREAGL